MEKKLLKFGFLTNIHPTNSQSSWSTFKRRLCRPFWNATYIVRGIFATSYSVCLHSMKNILAVHLKSDPAVVHNTVNGCKRVFFNSTLICRLQWVGIVCGYIVWSKIIQHYNGVIMSAMAFQITGISIVCSTVCSGADQQNIKPPVTGEFPAQKASIPENVFISWRRHARNKCYETEMII